MAEVTSGTVKSDTQWYSTFYVSWNRTSYSAESNTSTIAWEAGLITSNGVYWLTNAVKINSIYINGSAVLTDKTYSNISGNGTHKLASGTTTIKHNDDGKKTFSVSINGWLYDTGSPSGSGTFELKQIPRYLSITSLEITNKTETSVVVKWSVSDPRSGTYYSLDNGATWTGSATYGESLASDGKSGTFNIQGLKANTAYNLKVKIKRTDSGLWTESSNMAFTTYAYPYCTSAPNFTIGNSLKIEFYNPLQRQLNWQVIGADGSTIATNITTGTSYTGLNDDFSVGQMYKSIPNTKSGTYTVKITYAGNVATKTGGTYSIKGTEAPTINSFDYYDADETVVALTGDATKIVQNYSKLRARCSDATPNNGAGGISAYKVECNGIVMNSGSSGEFIFGAVNSSSNIDLKLTVTDTRGLSASKTIKVTMLAHSKPTANVTLERLNNYEDETYLTVDGSVSSIDGKNTMTIKYRYKWLGGSYGDYHTIGDKVKQTLYLNKNDVYIFNVHIVDALGSVFSAEYNLGKGVFPMFIDTDKNSVGVNCFPNNDNSFEVDGLIISSGHKCKNLLYTPYTESNKLTLNATKDDYVLETGYYCHLETGKKYTFSCKTDGTWGGSNATDTVEAFLIKDKAYTTYVSITSNPKTITVSATGTYFLRVDVNKKGITHSFWDFQVEEGSSATDYTEAKQFEYRDQYYLGEHKVGYWFNGKPLYRQIISLGASQFGTTEVTTGQTISIPHNIANIENIVKMEDIWYSNYQFRKFPSNYYGSAGWDGQYFCTTTDIKFELGSEVYNRLITSTSYLYIVIYYTKK